MANPEYDNYTPKPQRYRIMGDESGHEYYVPVDQEAQFEEWVAAEGCHDVLDFDENRIDGRFTFTDPRCE